MPLQTIPLENFPERSYIQDDFLSSFDYVHEALDVHTFKPAFGID